MQKILFLLFVVLVNYSQICSADDNRAFHNPYHQYISLEQIYEKECGEHIQYIKNLKLYQSLKKIGKKIEQRINYQKSFRKELVDGNKNKTALVCDFKSGVKFDGFIEPYSYIKTELKVFRLRFCFEGRFSNKEQEAVLLFEKRF